MIRNRKTLEEQLAEARAKKEQAAARLDQLEARRKARDTRMRAWGEKVLVGVALHAAASNNDLKSMLEGLIANADLNPKQREAAFWVLSSLAPSIAPESDTAVIVPNGGGVASQVG
jgi:flagellar biosynthesis chaperone FliJ